MSERRKEELLWVPDVAETVSLSSCRNGDGMSGLKVTDEVRSELVGITDILLFGCVPNSAWHFGFLRLGVRQRRRVESKGSRRRC